jgi:predicted phage baseplate assembly protein
VEQGAIKQVLNGVAGIEQVLNPAPAEGGADGEVLASLLQRGPRTLRHRGRALTGGDYEVMAVEASPAVAVARAKPARDRGGRRRPGWVTLVILPRSKEPRPQPSFGLRELVRRYIEERAPAELAGLQRIFVTGPEYCAIDVQAAVAPLPAAAAGDVEEALRGAIMAFLHPLTGGPEGAGWAEGRDVFLSDLASVLERVEGVDYVRELVLLRDRRPQGESARVPKEATAVAGEVRVELV